MTAAPFVDKSSAFAVRRPLLLGFLTLVALVSGLFGWGGLASISGAVIATGKVDVETRDQIVEHLDGGTVGEILVKDGGQVTAGQVLLRLDGEKLRAQVAMLEAEHADLVARRNRLEAEFADADTIDWVPALAVSAKANPAVAAVLEGQLRLFRARRESRAGLEAQLRERIGQMRKQIAGLAAQAEAVKRQFDFTNRELETQRGLFKEGLGELNRLLTLEREAAALEGQAGDIEARIAEARGRIAEIEVQILQIGAERMEESESQAREVQADEHQVAEQLSELQRRLDSMEVTAPVSGEVFGMMVSTVGEVVRPGEPILRIVPEGAALVVRAELEPIHVDQVWPGQEAVLRFSAFSARTTPEYSGQVIRVSADAQTDERTGLSWYEVELSMGTAVKADQEIEIMSWLPDGARDWLREQGLGSFDETPGRQFGDAPSRASDLALAPGMPVEVHLRTGERSPLSYLVKPLTDYFARSLREE